MRSLMVPSAEDNNGIEGCVNIYLSSKGLDNPHLDDFDSNINKCIFLIQGTGDIRAGYVITI